MSAPTLRSQGIRKIPVSGTVITIWDQGNQRISFLWPDPDPTLALVHRHTVWVMHGPELVENVCMEVVDALSMEASWILLQRAKHARVLGVKKARELLDLCIKDQHVHQPFILANT